MDYSEARDAIKSEGWGKFALNASRKVSKDKSAYIALLVYT